VSPDLNTQTNKSLATAESDYLMSCLLLQLLLHFTDAVHS